MTSRDPWGHPETSQDRVGIADRALTRARHSGAPDEIVRLALDEFLYAITNRNRSGPTLEDLVPIDAPNRPNLTTAEFLAQLDPPCAAHTAAAPRRRPLRRRGARRS